MLRMIIADDEYIALDGIKSIIPWEEFGIEIVAEATNGQEAFDLCLQLNPDILFTDIRMPAIDGLEVALKLRELGSDIKIIILSGAQDFNFAKTAMNIDAEGYILKPVKKAELKEVVMKVVRSITIERNKEQKMRQLTVQLHENMAAMKGIFLRNLISGIYVNEQELKEKMEYFRISVESDETLIAAVVQIDDYLKTTEGYSEEDKQLLSFSVSNILDEIISNYKVGFSLLIDEKEFVIIFIQKAQYDNRHLEICEEISSCISRFLNLTVSIGMGHSVDSILQLGAAYKSAKSVMQYRFYSGKGSILLKSDIDRMNGVSKNLESIEYSNLYEAENKLVNYMKIGDEAAVSEIINEIFNYLCSIDKMSVDYVNYCCAEIVSIVSRAIFELGESIDDIIAKRSVILENINKMENIFDLKNYMLLIFLNAAAYFSKRHKQKNSTVVERINKIIENKYMEDIDIRKISNEIYLTPNYISLIYKKETGESIIEHLTRIRMEIAKELLRTTEVKVSEIAEKVGYESQFYFSKVFKKYTGIHPTKFREKN